MRVGDAEGVVCRAYCVRMRGVLVARWIYRCLLVVDARDDVQDGALPWEDVAVGGDGVKCYYCG